MIYAQQDKSIILMNIFFCDSSNLIFESRYTLPSCKTFTQLLCDNWHLWLFQNLWLSRASKFLLYEMKLVMNGNLSGLHEKKTINQIIIEHNWNNLRRSMIGTGILICLSCPLYPLLSWNGIENVKHSTWNIFICSWPSAWS